MQEMSLEFLVREEVKPAPIDTSLSSVIEDV